MSQAKQMLKHSSIYAVGNFSRQIVGFIMLPIYTRYLTPADYGVVGLLVFMVSLIELVFGARMFHAVTKFYYEQENKEGGHSVVSTAYLITAAVSSLTVLAVVAFRDPISGIVFGSAEYGILVAMFSVLVLTQSLENYAMGYIRIQQRPWLFVGCSTLKLVLQLSLNIALVVVLEMGVMGVAISNVASAVIFVSGLTIYTFWNTGLRYSRYLARRMLMFSWPLWLSGVAGLYIGSSNRYYIRIFGDLDEVGLFGLAAKFGTIISVLVWMPFSQYWQTERFSLYHQSNPIPIYQSVFRFITTLLALVALGVAIFSGPVIRLMADSEFHDAARAVPYLAFAGLFQCLTLFTNFSFLVKEKTGWMTWNSYATAAVATVLYMTLIPLMGYVGASQALMLAYGIQFAIVHVAAKKQYDMQLSLKPLFFYLLISAGCIALAFQFEQADLIRDLLVKVLIYGMGCVLLAAPFLSNPEVRDYIADFVSARLSLKSRPERS